MRWLGKEYTLRETILLFSVITLLIGFLLNVWAFQKDINEYKKAYKECEFLRQNTFYEEDQTIKGQYIPLEEINGTYKKVG